MVMLSQLLNYCISSLSRWCNKCLTIKSFEREFQEHVSNTALKSLHNHSSAMIQQFPTIHCIAIMVLLLSSVLCNPKRRVDTKDDYGQDVEMISDKTDSSGGDIDGKSADCSGGGGGMMRGGGGQSQPIIIVTGGSGGSSPPMTPPADDGGGSDAGGSRRRRARRRRARLVRMARRAARKGRTSG